MWRVYNTPMRTKIFLLAILAVLGLGVFVFYSSLEGGAEQSEAEDVVKNWERRDVILAKIGSHAFRLRVARTERERAQGLGGVAALVQNEGMLFTFQNDGLHGIWMKDMRIPIDILWLSNDFQIVDFAEKVSPDSFPRIFTPTTPARFVVELPAGAKKASGVAAGDAVQFFEQ